MDDDQSRPRLLVQCDRGGDPLAVGALEVVVFELARVGVAEVHRLALLGQEEHREIGKSFLDQCPACRVQAMGIAWRSFISESRSPSDGGGSGRTAPGAVEQREQPAQRRHEPLPDEPGRDQHQAEREVERLRRSVQDAILAGAAAKRFPHRA